MTMNKTSSLPVNSNGNNTINNNSNMHIRLANLKDQKNLLDKCIHELELEIIEIDSGGRDNSLKHIVEIEPVQEQYRKICSIYCKFQSAPKILVSTSFKIIFCLGFYRIPLILKLLCYVLTCRLLVAIHLCNR